MSSRSQRSSDMRVPAHRLRSALAAAGLLDVQVRTTSSAVDVVDGVAVVVELDLGDARRLIELLEARHG